MFQGTESSPPSVASEQQPEASPERGFVRRALLALMAFTAGAAVMVIELSAIRVLAPWFGNSLYTWTGLIGVILTAMSAGYYFGGWLADKKTSYSVLGHILAGAALFILAIPLMAHVLGRPLARLDVILGPVLATLLLFALPGFFLGSVSPYIIRLVSLLSADRHIGLSAGTVYMVSTIGSVLGTFAAGFWLIPRLDLEQVFWLTGGAVAGLAVLGYVLARQRGGVVAVQVLLVAAAIPLLIVAASLAKPLPEARLLYQKVSYYHLIRVFYKKLPSGEGITELYLDTTREGAQYDRSSLFPVPYQGYLELAPLFTGQPTSALFLGGGAFTMPQAFLNRFPTARVRVVEIDPEVVAVGRRFFRLNEYPALDIAVDDARRYLTRTTARYDLIFGDVYNGVRSVPSHLLTREFFQAVKGRLTERGIFMMHLINAVQGKDAVLFGSVMKTLAQVFREVRVFATLPREPGKIQSLVIMAADFDLPVDAVLAGLPPDQQGLGKMLRTCLPPETHAALEGYLLTDRFNPVEYLIARTLR